MIAVQENLGLGSGGALEAPDARPRVAGLVSVVIPAYNAAKSIRRCLEHALAQTYPHVEIIVVNDGSTDETESIVRGEFGDRVRCVSQPNGGETAARNTGFGLARGEFVT